MKPLKLAVVGVGHFGGAHARQISSLPGVELAGVVDPKPDSRRRAEKQYGAQAWSHHRELIGTADAAIVATPTRLHHQIARDLLEAGVHLLVEKPLASTLLEAEELVDLATRRGLVLQVGHIERFNPTLTSVSANIQDPKFIEARRTSGHRFRSVDIGVVLDLMIHDIDLVLSVVRSPVRRCEALGISVFGEFEDAAQARLDFENGCVAMLTASRASYDNSRTMQIWSQRAFASVDFAERNVTIARPSEELLRRQFDVASQPAERIERLKEHLFDDLFSVEVIQAEACDQLAVELTDFAESIRQGRSPRVTGAQGRDAIAVAERVLEAIAAHTWDGHRDGRVGPLAQVTPQVLRGPHWGMAAQSQSAEPRENQRREAG